uniref:Uncharacterized protein n=1 Tax=Cajanus cajan TaxID=3821 RepID=A0A151RWT1_CAJCA|nr:hypothetical protein KK1_031429 [Cajanus cajan]
MASNYLPPPGIPSEPSVPEPWSWTPTLPTFPPPTSYFSSSDDSDSDSSSSTFGIIIGISVGVLGIILLFAIWYKYLRKKHGK